MRRTTDIRCRALDLLALIFLALSGCSGGGGGGGGSGGGAGGGTSATGTQVVSALGTPSGTSTTATIDSSGGTIADGAGSFALKIPAGALPSPTQITVTPLSSTTAPWQTTASGFGITGLGSLTNPATVSIKHTGVNVQNPSADTLGVAMQDVSGAWWYFSNPSWDGTSMVVTLDPAVLSALPAAGSRTAAAAPLGPNDAGSLWVYERRYITGKSDLFVKDFDDYSAAACSPQALGSGNETLLQFTDGTCQRLEKLPGDVIWTVNGSETGNSTVGFLEDNCSGVCAAQYQAPAKVPPTNPVTIQALYVLTSPQIPIYKSVTIHDLGKYSVKASFDSPTWPVCAFTAPTRISDSLSFTLTALPPTMLFDVSSIHDDASLFVDPPAPPGVDTTLTVGVGPEIFLTTQNVTGELVIGSAPPGFEGVLPLVVEVTINGTGRSAQCTLIENKDGLIIEKQESSVAQTDGVVFRFDPDPKKFDGSFKQQVVVPAAQGTWTFEVEEIF